MCSYGACLIHNNMMLASASKALVVPVTVGIIIDPGAIIIIPTYSMSLASAQCHNVNQSVRVLTAAVHILACIVSHAVDVQLANSCCLYTLTHAMKVE